MHLLHYDGGQLTLAKNIGEDTVDYAILSHTWGDDDEEVNFADVTQASLDKAKSKVGFQKVQFCLDRAAQEAGLKYSWIDTCCINKADAVEVNESINSMFRWYKNAKKCYVYLSDVSLSSREDGQPVGDWKSAFRRSRWFTRGWTLQELLAPPCVLFYSREGFYLGDRVSLLQLIREIVAIPVSALANFVPASYSAEQLFSWTDSRDTKRAEDMAYCLLGLFGVSMPLVYGEGREKAIRRLRREIEERDLGLEDKQCVRDLFQTDPRDDKTRIERTKGGLLQDAFRWILENNTFRQWHDDPQASFLWIRGDPGKGKTMLLCGIIDELEHKTGAFLSYFFCQETDERLSNATAVLRGLVYMLLMQRPGLIAHVRKKYDTQGKGLFEGTNAWEAMSKILKDMLQDKQAANAVLLIDALDECTVDLPKLLELVSGPTGAKWIVTSRNWPSISSRLAGSEQAVHLSLELNRKAISSAVDTYIRCKVDDLALKNGYSQDTSHSIQQHLTDNADGTFLWVALVCQVLANTRPWNAPTVVRSFPMGLRSLYKRMIDSIRKSEDAKICQNVLAVASTVYRPVTLSELHVLCERMKGMDAAHAEFIVRLCGSFLTLREGVVYFVHQSAKEHLVNNEAGWVFPSGIAGQHAAIASRSLAALHALRRDIYDLDDVGEITDITPPACDPLAPIRYACVFWVDHLQEAGGTAAEVALEDGGAVHNFLRQKYLYWLEALSLLNSMPGGVLAIRKLENMARIKGSEVSSLIYDAWRFVLSFRHAIEIAPLQAYVSALLFCPRRSKVRELFKAEEPDWSKVMSTDMLDVDWGAHVETLEGHKLMVHGVCFSPDGKQIASASGDGTLRLWDTASGKCVLLLACGIPLLACAFSPNGNRIATVSSDGTMNLWNTSGACIWTVRKKHAGSMAVAFSPDGKLLAWAIGDRQVLVMDVTLGECKWDLQTESHCVSIIFSADGGEVACGVRGDTLIVCDIASGQLHERGVQDGTLSMAKLLLGEPHTVSPEWLLKSWHLASGQSGGTSRFGSSCVISPDGRRIAFRKGWRSSTEIRDVASGMCMQQLYDEGARALVTAFSPDGQRLVTGFWDGTIRVQDVKVKAAIGEESQEAAKIAENISEITFSPDGQIVVSTSRGTCRVWDAASGQCKFTLREHRSIFSGIAFSADSQLLASASDHVCKVWDVASAEWKHTVDDPYGNISAVALSPRGQLLAWGSQHGSCIIQNLASGQKMYVPAEYGKLVNKMIFSPNGSLLALALATRRGDDTCLIWDVARRQVRLKIKLEVHPETIAFSPDGRTLAIRSADLSSLTYARIEIWDVESGQCKEKVEDSANVLLMRNDQLPPDLTQPWNYAPSKDGRWLTLNGQQIVWIPTMLRGKFARCGRRVAFRNASRNQILVFDMMLHTKRVELKSSGRRQGRMPRESPSG